MLFLLLDGLGVPVQEGLLGGGECHTPVSEASYCPMGPPWSPSSAPGEAHPLRPQAKTTGRRSDFGPGGQQTC